MPKIVELRRNLRMIIQLSYANVLCLRFLLKTVRFFPLYICLYSKIEKECVFEDSLNFIKINIIETIFNRHHAVNLILQCYVAIPYYLAKFVST